MSEALRGRPPYQIARGGDDEPELLLVIDNATGIVIARSSEIASTGLVAMVFRANSATFRPISPPSSPHPEAEAPTSTQPQPSA